MQLYGRVGHHAHVSPYNSALLTCGDVLVSFDCVLAWPHESRKWRGTRYAAAEHADQERGFKPGSELAKVGTHH